MTVPPTPVDDSSVTVTPGAPTKSMAKAYLLWLLAGFFGAHRLYLGRWATGMAYLVLLLLAMIGVVVELLGLLGIFLVVDALLIPRMTRKRNAQLAEQFREHPERFVILDRDDIAPWARRRGSGFLYVVATPFRVFAFLFLPAVVAYFAVFLRTYELVAFPIVILLATGLVTSLDEIVTRNPALQQIPGVDSALARVREMRQYYWDHEPRMFASFWGMFRRAFTEYRPYWKIIGVVIVAIAVETAFSYSSDYPPYLSPADAAQVFFIHATVVVIAVMINLVPLSALSFRYSLSGKRYRLRILTVAALATIVLAFVSGIKMEKGDDEPSILSTERLGLRMEKLAFRNALQQKLDLFLTYYLPGSGRTAATDSVLTEELRQILVGIAPNDEVEAFEVVGQSTWRGVRYKRDDGPLLLSVADAYGVHHRWNAMPAPLDEQVLMFTKPAAHCRVCDWLRAERWPTLGGCDVASVDG